jgi:hypothetical protein
MGGDRRHGSEGEQAQRAHAASVERGTGSWNGAIAGEGPDANRGALGKNVSRTANLRKPGHRQHSSSP